MTSVSGLQHHVAHFDDDNGAHLAGVFETREHPCMGTTPTFDAYLANLPNGLDSYDEMMVKAGIVATVADDVARFGVSRAQLAAELPAPLGAFISDLPPSSSWVPEVKLQALSLYINDRFMPDDQEQWRSAYDVNTKLLSGAAYKFMLGMISPSRVLKMGAMAYNHFHKGSRLTVIDTKTEPFLIRQAHPPHAVAEPMARMQTAILTSSLHVAGNEHAQVTLASHDAHGAEFQVTLSPQS